METTPESWQFSSFGLITEKPIDVSINVDGEDLKQLQQDYQEEKESRFSNIG